MMNSLLLIVQDINRLGRGQTHWLAPKGIAAGRRGKGGCRGKRRQKKAN
jgi:hypothetical protein